MANYPPLYPLLQTLGVKQFGPAFWYGRLLSCLSIVASSLLIVGILRTLTVRWTQAVVSGLTLLCIPYVSYWAPLFRVDALALACSLAGLFVLVRWPSHRRALLVTAVFLTLAVYTRQSYALAAPFAALVWLFTARTTRRRAFELAALLAGLGGAIS